MREVSRSSSSGGAESLSGGGEMGAQIRAFDWSKTPLGAIETWPQSLRTVTGLLLDSNPPMLIAWGRAFTLLYNDACRALLGTTRLKATLGQRAADVLGEIWERIGPVFNRVLEVGEAATVTDLRLELAGRGTDLTCDLAFAC